MAKDSKEKKGDAKSAGKKAGAKPDDKKAGVRADARKANGKPDAKAAVKQSKGREAKPDAGTAVPEPSLPKDYVPRLKVHYNEVVRKQLVDQFAYKNPMQVPRLDKIVLNMGIGEAVADGKVIAVAVEELTRIAGQKPVVTRSRKSIATYKIRENQAIGAKVTLRQARMYEFLDRFINIALPRVRDFRGATDRSFDGRGNYAIGVKEHIIFPEIDYDKIDKVWGLDIVICTTAQTDEEARALIAGFNFPFRKAHRAGKAAA